MWRAIDGGVVAEAKTRRVNVVYIDGNDLQHSFPTLRVHNVQRETHCSSRRVGPLHSLWCCCNIYKAVPNTGWAGQHQLFTVELVRHFLSPCLWFSSRKLGTCFIIVFRRGGILYCTFFFFFLSWNIPIPENQRLVLITTDGKRSKGAVIVPLCFP